ncbi:MAG: aspartyl-tRNA(Asn)/glutamyl-tRNA(Gln) amidotransferase subunit C [Verrucomicrobiales bacterium]|jgi:aspartyl-tRNA(Asn)/glutamyl-tRNA(Gln) amidotransferase subunit C
MAHHSRIMADLEFDVGYVANLARLKLSEEEKERYQGQLVSVLDYMRQIDSIDVSGVEPMAHASPVFDVMREDELRESLSREDVLRNAPQVLNEQFAVTKVVEDA